MLKGHLDGGALVILPGFEVAEALRTAAGKERPGRGRVGSLHRRVEHRLQAAVPLPRQIGGRPAGQWILGRSGEPRQCVRRQRCQPSVQVGDDVEIGDQRAQLGGRAEHQLGAGIDVERLVQAVGVDAHKVAVAAALVQDEAPGDLFRIAVPQ